MDVISAIIQSILSNILGSILQSITGGPPPEPPPSVPAGIVRPALQQGPLAIMSPPSNGFAQFGSETLRLSADLQITDTQNRIVMPMSLQGPVPVLYKLDQFGSVQRVWVLTPEEAEIADRLIKQRSQTPAPKQ